MKRKIKRDKNRGITMAIGSHCKDCGAVFYIARAEIAWFEQKGMPTPKRCQACRKKRREAAVDAQK